jgi:peptidoglycan-N-acetylglucosamine deacetylase
MRAAPLVAVLVSLSLLWPGSGPAAAAAAQEAGAASAVEMQASPVFSRAGGGDRYATAALASQRTFPPGVAIAYVATGEAYADGLAAGPAAARDGGPVLLTRHGDLPPATARELDRLRPRRIVVVGGLGAVSAAVATSLQPYATGGVARVAGSDRYATAAALSRSTAAAGVDTVYVASGVAFPDALSGGAAAAARQSPLLLTAPNAVPSSTAAELGRLRPRRIVVVGGPAVVSADVAARLAGYASAGVQRLAGTDRYGTAAAVARATWPRGSTTVLLASGENFPDGVVAAAVAGRRDAPVLLTSRAHVPWSIWQEVRRLSPAEGVVLGGGGVVPDARIATLRRSCHAGVAVRRSGQETFASVPSAPGTLALTFDMGGRLTPALDILRFLIASDVCATIFPTGAMSATAEGRRVIELIGSNRDLFEVGNHTMHHCDLVRGGGGSPTTAPCAGGPPTQARIGRELREADEVIRSITGVGTAPYWRPPYGSHNAAVRDAAAVAGYTKTVMWSVDTVDWRPVAEGGPTAAQISDGVVRRAAGGGIVLFHLGGWHTLAALEMMVPRLRARGLTLTTVSHQRSGG